MMTEQEITDIVRGHFQLLEPDRRTFYQMREAANHRLWSPTGPMLTAGSMWLPSGIQGNALPIRLQVNTLRPYLERSVGLLYKRQPRATVTRPPIVSARSNRKLSQEMADALSEVATVLIRGSSFRAHMENALEQGVLMPGCAIKLGYDEDSTAEPIERVWLEVVERWDAVWDERATTCEQQRYRGHLRWARLECAKEQLPGLEVDASGTYPIADYLQNGWQEVAEKDRAAGYVRVLDWYDLESGEWQVFHWCGDTAKACGSTPQVFPYSWPNGKPLVPLFPVILSNSVGQPMRPVSRALPVLQETIEKSLILSIVVNAMRRDTARVLLFLKSKGIPNATIDRIMNAWDTEAVGIEGDDLGPLAQLFHVLQLPEISGTLDKAQRYVSMGAGESSPMSALGRGQTSGLEYAAATTAQSLAQGDASAASVPAERMSAHMADIVKGVFAILAAHSQGLKLSVGGQVVTVPVDVLRQNWQVAIDDAATEAAKRAGVRAEILQAAPLYMQAVAMASTGMGADGKEVPSQQRVAAQNLVDFLAEFFDLPDRMRWKAIVDTEPDVEAEDEAADLAEDAQEAATGQEAESEGGAPAPVALPPDAVQSAASRIAGSYSQEEIQAMLDHVKQQGGG